MKLHGLDDDKLNGKIGILRTLVASTGKFSIELDGDDPCSALVEEQHWFQVCFVCSISLAWFDQICARKDGTVQVKPGNISKV